MSKRWVVIGLVVALMGAVALGIAQSQGNVLTAVKVPRAPVVDGVGDDDAWDVAPAVNIAVSGGANIGSTTVALKAVYVEGNIYFLAQWKDPTQSLRRAPWQKQADGSWKKLADPNDKGGDNNLYYEDKLAFIWNINDSIQGFNQSGCFVTCHAGENPDKKPFGNKYTANPGEIGDIWHWKAVRTGPAGQMDDQYVDNTRYDPDKAPDAGRKSDPRVRGGYSDNVNATKTGPAFTSWTQPAPPYWIMDNEKQPLPSPDSYKPGDEIAGIIVSPFVGDRGDITAKATYADGQWTLELTRKLFTGSPFDVQFTDLNKSYFFGVAVFDNAQVRHAFQTGVSELRFAK